ncbi:MAG: sigma-70 family RNA polymerase sigma factor [Bacteroidia bacterium]|nr:sigma-70 family RNA polymerase sigma factor [Bacteroidia bacterium]
MAKLNHIRTQAEIENENRLVEAAKKNPRRFAPLYERYFEVMFLFVVKRVGEEELARDLTQQLFIKAMENLKKYQFRGLPFSAWLYQIAKNEVAQFFRKNKQQRVVSMETHQISDLMEEMDEKNSDEGVRRMVDAFQLLSFEEVELIEMKYFEKLPYKEIAVIYGISVNNAKVKMHRLLQKLKKLMLKDGFPEKKY